MKFDSLGRILREYARELQSTLGVAGKVIRSAFDNSPKILATLASIATVIGLFLALKDFSEVSTFYQTTLQTNAYWEQTLNSLNVQENREYFNSKLGKPITTTYINDTYKEDIYMNKLFYVTTVVGRADKVLIFSITTRDRSFQPYLKLSNVRLGEDTFSVNQKPQMTGFYETPHDFYYEELFYRGNPGNYLTYAYATGNASAQTVWPKVEGKVFRDILTVAEHNCKDEIYKTFPILNTDYKDVWRKTAKNRKSMVITSIGIISPSPGFICDGLGIDNIPEFSPNNNLVRLFRS